MGANEIAALRDILVITAASALVVSSIFTVLVAWRVWRLLVAARGDARPLVEALTDAAETVEDTVRYVGTRIAAPAADGVAVARRTGGAAGGSVAARLRRFNAALKGERG